MSALKSVRTSEPVPEPEVNAEGAVAQSAAQAARVVRHQRAVRLARQLLGWVVLPTVLSAVYYFGVARDQYQSFATLIVRGGHASSGVMLQEYLQSRDVLALLEQRVRFSAHYAEHGDLLFRLAPDAGSETRYHAFRRTVSVRYDSSSGLVTLVVKAYSPEAARNFARVMVDEAGRFLGSLEVEPGSANEQGSAKVIQIARPSLPSESSYPQRGYAVVTAFFVSLALFVIGSVLIMAVREHAQF